MMLKHTCLSVVDNAFNSKRLRILSERWTYKWGKVLQVNPTGDVALSQWMRWSPLTHPHRWCLHLRRPPLPHLRSAHLLAHSEWEEAQSEQSCLGWRSSATWHQSPVHASTQCNCREACAMDVPEGRTKTMSLTFFLVLPEPVSNSLLLLVMRRRSFPTVKPLSTLMVMKRPEERRTLISHCPDAVLPSPSSKSQCMPSTWRQLPPSRLLPHACPSQSWRLWASDHSSTSTPPYVEWCHSRCRWKNQQLRKRRCAYLRQLISEQRCHLVLHGRTVALALALGHALHCQQEMHHSHRWSSSWVPLMPRMNGQTETEVLSAKGLRWHAHQKRLHLKYNSYDIPSKHSKWKDPTTTLSTLGAPDKLSRRRGARTQSKRGGAVMLI